MTRRATLRARLAPACLTAAGLATMCFTAAAAQAETAYVSDDLILGVYAEKGQQGAKLTTLHSGVNVEIIARDNEFSQIRLANGTLGWVKSSFLTTREPAVVRVKALEEELSRIKSTTPEMAEAAARSELATLKQQLEAKQKELDAAKGDDAGKAAAAPETNAVAEKSGAKRGDSIGLAVLLGVVCLAVGFAAGYATLERRIRAKFGGVKVF